MLEKSLTHPSSLYSCDRFDKAALAVMKSSKSVIIQYEACEKEDRKRKKDILMFVNRKIGL